MELKLHSHLQASSFFTRKNLRQQNPSKLLAHKLDAVAIQHDEFEFVVCAHENSNPESPESVDSMTRTGCVCAVTTSAEMKNAKRLIMFQVTIYAFMNERTIYGADRINGNMEINQHCFELSSVRLLFSPNVCVENKSGDYFIFVQKNNPIEMRTNN